MSEARTPTDGQPFYCKLCGAGYGEYAACEMPDCELEGSEEARARAPIVHRPASNKRTFLDGLVTLEEKEWHVGEKPVTGTEPERQPNYVATGPDLDSLAKQYGLVRQRSTPVQAVGQDGVIYDVTFVNGEPDESLRRRVLDAIRKDHRYSYGQSFSEIQNAIQHAWANNVAANWRSWGASSAGYAKSIIEDVLTACVPIGVQWSATFNDDLSVLIHLDAGGTRYQISLPGIDNHVLQNL